MTMNYLQYIGSRYDADPSVYPEIRFLVSGADPEVRQIVGQNIVSSCYARGMTLFVVDNTRSSVDLHTRFGEYRVADVLNGGVNLCSDLLDINSIKGISRLRILLADIGFDGISSMKVISYLSFVRETERRLGNAGPLTAEILEDYGGTMLVKWKLNQLMQTGNLSKENYEYLIGRYSEISAAGADFELFLTLLAPFLEGASPSGGMAVHFPFGEFASDKPLQQLMSKLLYSYIKQNSSQTAVLILDDGKGDRNFIIDILNNIPVVTEIHMISNDIFSFSDAERSVFMNSFPVRIYTRHEDMQSCEKIENHCGQIDVIKRSSTVTIDKRFKANSAWDILFGTNRTETEIKNAPTKEYRFRKEMINSLPSGNGIIDYSGDKVLFSF